MLAVDNQKKRKCNKPKYMESGNKAIDQKNVSFSARIETLHVRNQFHQISSHFQVFLSFTFVFYLFPQHFLIDLERCWCYCLEQVRIFRFSICVSG